MFQMLMLFSHDLKRLSASSISNLYDGHTSELWNAMEAVDLWDTQESTSMSISLKSACARTVVCLL